MENVWDEEQPPVKKMKSTKPSKAMSKIVNNRSMNQQIYQLFVQKRFKQCLQLISRYQSDQFKIYINALIQRQSFKLQKSLGLLSQCQAMNKINFNYLKIIAKNFFLLGKYKSSLEAAKDALKLNNGQYEIFYILGKISLALNDPQNAIIHFKFSIDKELNEESFIQIAKIQIKKKQFIEASKTLKQAIKVSSENPQLYQIFADLYLQIGHQQQAIQLFKSALEKDNYLYHSLLATATLQHNNNEIESSIQNYKKAYKISPNSSVLWNNIGIYMWSKKKMIAAYSCFKHSLFLDPFRYDVHANIALLLMNNKKYLAAHVHLRTAIQFKKDSLLLNWLGVCLSELGDYVNATNAFEQSLGLLDNWQTQINLIICLIRAEKRAQAKIIYGRMCKNSLYAKNEQIQEYITKLNKQF